MQMLKVPVIDAGNAFTDTTTVLLQLLGIVYVIVAVPAVAPVTTPVVKPTLATLPMLLVHTPPSESFVREVVLPAQMVVAPVIAAGSGLTVKIAVRAQPVPTV